MSRKALASKKEFVTCVRAVFNLDTPDIILFLFETLEKSQGPQPHGSRHGAYN